MATAALVRTFRHDRSPIHLRTGGTTTVILLATGDEQPAAWEGYEPVDRPVLVRGAAADLTHAYEKTFSAGEHEIDPVGNRRLTSPVILLSESPVHRIETPAGLLRRMEFATRGFPRKMAAAALAALILLTLLLASGIPPWICRHRQRA
jgi:hypothetical protein